MQFGGVQRVGGGQPLAEHINELVEIWGLGHERDQRREYRTRRTTAASCFRVERWPLSSAVGTGLAVMPFRANDGERVGCDDFPGLEVAIAIGVRPYRTCERDTWGRV
jgi:hypothetical protein